MGDSRVISGVPSLRVQRALAAVTPLIAFLFLSGCEYSGYSKDLIYPMRSDPIVVSAPKTEQPFSPPAPGQLDKEIAGIAAKGGQTIDPNDAKTIAADQRGMLQTALNKTFGRPHNPTVGPTDAEADFVAQLTQLKIRDEDAKNPFQTLRQGSKLYRYHCVHCHGLTGDGRGPTGPWEVPHPRDYRSGEFKFISAINVGANTRPRRDDLVRTLRMGIEGTSMPSFRLLEVRDPENKNKENDLEALVSYVMHLSIRGLVEVRMLKEIAGGNTFSSLDDADGKVQDMMKEVVEQWANSNAKPITPAEHSYVEVMSTKAKAESIRHGYNLFSDPKGDASCIGCHADYGRQVNFRYDDWGTLVRPMNLTSGVYRGGRRPIDLFWRIKGGIGPSGMPKTGLPKDEDIWDVVNFVQALPYPQMLPEDVRFKIYDRPPEEKTTAERAEK